MARAPIKADSVSLSERELLRAEEVGALFFGCSRSTIYSWLSDGWLPRPVRLAGHKNRWRRVELLDWIAAGCPPASRWRWTPSRLGVYETLIQEANAELEDLCAERAELEDEIVALRRIKGRV